MGMADSLVSLVVSEMLLAPYRRQLPGPGWGLRLRRGGRRGPPHLQAGRRCRGRVGVLSAQRTAGRHGVMSTRTLPTAPLSTARCASAVRLSGKRTSGRPCSSPTGRGGGVGGGGGGRGGGGARRPPAHL